ncbi:MAG TPA: hypothetical protein PLW24_15120 [Burkholderiaceae bacterium]|nr:hypothetical protein [Burkholderiaceae bacterium]HNB45392.1 hypothetical protein [Burkholderiaceae bacterium]HNG80801.1 hypothetical protein [Burkholderiaceae bacterium]
MSQLQSASAPDISLVIFGLDSRTTLGDVQALLCCCGVPLHGAWAALEVEFQRVPGDSDQVYAHVLHLPGRLLANRLADGVNARRHRGRRLQSWVPVMDWS